MKKVFIVLIIVILLSVCGLILFFPFDSIIKEKIDKALGSDVSIRHLKIKWNSITANDIIIKTPSGTTFLQIKELKLKPYLLALLKKKIEIKDIQIESPTLFLTKNSQGKWLLPAIKDNTEQRQSVAFSIKTLKASNGIVIIQDKLKGFYMKLTDLDLTMESSISLFQSGKASFKASAKFNDRGSLSFKSEGDFSDEQFKGVLSIKDLNITVLRTYMKEDFIIKKGSLNLDSSFLFNKGYINAPSFLRAYDIVLESKGILFGVSASLIIELLKKNKEILLHFNIWGRWDNLQHDLEKSLKNKVKQEIGKTITSPLAPITKPLEKLIKKLK